MDCAELDNWIDDVGGESDGELRRAIERFCDMAPSPGVELELQEAYVGGGCCLDQPDFNKRARDGSCVGPKSKACCEKMRRDRLNDRFLELNSVLDPGRPPKSDKASILSDATRILTQLRSEAQELRELNEKLLEEVKDLKAEKNELKDEKTKLKADKERLDQQLKVMSMPPPGLMSHPMAMHPAAVAPAAYTMLGQAASKKGAVPYTAFPGMPMWHWMPPAVLDTTQDGKLWPPSA